MRLGMWNGTSGILRGMGGSGGKGACRKKSVGKREMTGVAAGQVFRRPLKQRGSKHLPKILRDVHVTGTGVERKSGNKNACPNFFGRRASVLEEQKTEQNRVGRSRTEKGPAIFNNPVDMLTAGVHTLAVLVPFIALRLVACRLASSRKTLPVLIPIRTHKLLARVTRRLRTLAVFVPLDAGRKIARLCLNRKRRHPADDDS